MYLRTGINIIIGLYTSRVILNTIGVTDYGIYSVIGGVIALSSFFTSSMSSATTRQITYALGKKNNVLINKSLNCSCVIHLCISLLVLILAESIGIWFLNNQMEFPIDRLNAANWVYQFSLMSVILSILATPFNAIIIAHEDFNFLALIGIAQTIANLIAVFILHLLPSSYDYLIYYSLLCLFIQIIYNLNIYRFSYNRYKISFNIRSLKIIDYKEQLSFSSWTIFGSCANLGYQQGINILFNILLNLSANAALGIANQINGKINMLVLNFQQAFNPQLTKSYATGDLTSVYKLIIQSAKFSFLVLFIFAFPTILNIDYILSIWLGQYPEYTASLSCLILVGSLIETLSGPLWITLYATGKIKIYQIAISIILLSSIPLTYASLKMGHNVNSAIIIRIILFIIGLFLRLYLLHKYIDLSITNYIRDVIRPIISVTVLSVFLYFLPTSTDTFYKFILFLFDFLIVCGVSYTVALNNNEKEFVKNIMVKKLNKRLWKTNK